MCSFIKCGLEIKQASSNGRPKQYYSSACRRAAEYEIRRIDASLADLENDKQAHRLGRMMDINGDNAALLTLEIEHAKLRLKGQLADGQE